MITLTQYWQAVLDLIDNIEKKEYKTPPEKGFSTHELKADPGYVVIKETLRTIANLGKTLEPLGMLYLAAPGMKMIDLNKNAKLEEKITGLASRTLIGEYIKLINHLAMKKVESKNTHLQRGLNESVFVPLKGIQPAGYDAAEKSVNSLTDAIKLYDARKKAGESSTIIKKYHADYTSLHPYFQEFNNAVSVINNINTALSFMTNITSKFIELEITPQKLNPLFFEQEKTALHPFLIDDKALQTNAKVAVENAFRRLQEQKNYDPKIIYAQIQSALSNENKKRWENHFKKLGLVGYIKSKLWPRPSNHELLITIVTIELVNNMKIMRDRLNTIEKEMKPITETFNSLPRTVKSDYIKSVLGEYIKTLDVNDNVVGRNKILAQSKQLAEANYPLAKIAIFMELRAYQEKVTTPLPFMHELINKTLESDASLEALLSCCKKILNPSRSYFFKKNPHQHLYNRLVKLIDTYKDTAIPIFQFSFTDNTLNMKEILLDRKVK